MWQTIAATTGAATDFSGFARRLGALRQADAELEPVT
jgi:hypothetical protein